MFESRYFECEECGHLFEVPYGLPRPESCPECGCCQVRRSLKGILFDMSVMGGYVP